MAACGALTSYIASCDKIQNATGGLKKRVWVGIIDDLDEDVPLNYDGNGYVESINFQAYKGFVTVTGVKSGNSGTVSAQQNEDGNSLFPQSVTIKVYDTTPDDKDFIANLTANDVFVVIETSTNRLELLGFPLGLSMESAEKSYGNTPTDSTARLLTLSGDQSEIEKVVGAGSYANTIAMLNSYVV